MPQRISFRVHGHVQGVFFRKFTQQQAQSYNLTGHVRNESDGSVSGEAQGEPAALDKLVADLHEGPRHAKVSKVDKRDIEPREGEQGFSTDG